MGKKSKESGGDTAVAVKSLFSIDNPFRRKPQTIAAAAFTGDVPQTLTKLGLVLDSSSSRREILTEAKIPGDDVAKTRKRKKDRGIEAVTPSPASVDEVAVLVKRNKLVVEDKLEETNNKKKKRKRSEVELEREKRNQLLGRDEAAAASTVVAVGEKRKVADVAADVLDTHDSFDDESKLLRTVFIGNLPLKTKRKALSREFAKFGEIESVRIRSVPLVDTKAPRKAAVIMGQINKEVDSVNAYIVFKDEQAAQAALSQNMAQVGGNHIRVDMACPPRKKMKGELRVYDRKKTAFVGNLPFDVKDEELYRLFCGLNPSEPNVEAVRVIRDPNSSAGKGIAYVLFKTRDAANEVCKRRDLKIRDRFLRICHAKSDAATPSNKVKEGPRSSFPHRNLATGSGKTPPGKGEKRKREAAASASYEGTRSSKNGIVKKTCRRLPTVKSNNDSMRSSWNEQKGGPKKRPAVAARKAKQLKKRKQAGGTPENAHRNKRVRKQ